MFVFFEKKYAQCSIKHCFDMIAHFEASDDQRKEGQVQFNEFMVSIYMGMYEKPEYYLVFPKRNIRVRWSR